MSNTSDNHEVYAVKSTPTTPETPRSGFKLPGSSGRKRYSYQKEDEIRILTDLVVRRPWREDGMDKWNEAAAHLKLNLKNQNPGQALKKHYYLMMQKHAAKNAKARRDSGVDEEYTEFDKLLQDCEDAMKDDDMKKAQEAEEKAMAKGSESEPNRRKSDDNGYQQAKAVRKAAAESLVSDDDDEDSPRPKRSRLANPMMSFVREGEARDHKLKMESIQIEQRRIALQEREMTIREDDAAHQRALDLKKLEQEDSRLQTNSLLMNMIQKLTEKL